MPQYSDLCAANCVLRSQLLQLGLGGKVLARRATLSVSSAVARAGRNVHAMGIGRKQVQGGSTTTSCVRIYVVQKLPRSLLSPRDVLPAEIDGIPTDVIEAEPAFILGKKSAAKKKAVKKTAKKAAAKKSSKKAAAKTAKKKVAASAVPACSTNRRENQRPVIGGISAGHRDVTGGDDRLFLPIDS
ncbi:MAG: hypothetical protein O3A00_28015 [Planctomycetota bacterium]|nr:hypothetical protein [Planctomycetota bacterium]